MSRPLPIALQRILTAVPATPTGASTIRTQAGLPRSATALSNTRAALAELVRLGLVERIPSTEGGARYRRRATT